jgi:hypothetical protein
MQYVLWVSIYVCIKEGEEKEEMSYTTKDHPWSWDQYNAPENDACVLA